VWRSTRCAQSGGRGLLESEYPFDLTQLGVGILEQGGALDDHIHTDLIPGRHLVDEAPKVELKFGHARRQLVPAPL
jgi:hypothetical protein